MRGITVDVSSGVYSWHDVRDTTLPQVNIADTESVNLLIAERLGERSQNWANNASVAWTLISDQYFEVAHNHRSELADGLRVWVGSASCTVPADERDKSARFAHAVAVAWLYNEYIADFDKVNRRKVEAP